MISQRLHSTGTDPVMAQLHNSHGSLNANFLHYVPEEVIEQPDNFFYRLRSLVAATEARMPFSAILPMGGLPITSSTKSVHCSNSNSNSNSNNITSITNMTSVENIRLIDGSTIVKGAMSLGG